MHPQLALRLLRRPAPTLDNYVAGANGAAVHALRHLDAGDAVWLWGAAGSGRTHLLLAVADAVGGRYLALESHSAPGLLADLGSVALVALDDVDSALGHGPFELELFRLINDLRAAGGRIVFGADAPPSGAGAALPDLASRLTRSTVFRLQPLDDDALLELLRTRARERALELPEAVCEWLLRRYPREPASLVALVDLIDEASARAGRTPSVPFVRELLGA